MQVAERLSHDLGFRLLVVDAIDEDASAFYARHDFALPDSGGLRLFMTTERVRRAAEDR